MAARKEELDEVMCWLAGYGASELGAQLKQGTDFERFFAEAPAPNPSRKLIDRPDLWDVIARSRLGSFTEGLLLFSASQPGVLAPMRDLVEGLEAISPPYPRGSFVCGAKATTEPTWTVDSSAFLCYDGMNTVFPVDRVPPHLLS